MGLLDQPTAVTGAQPLTAVIDLEASGFGRGSYPIEVGFVLPDGSSWCSLIRPPTHWTHWDGRAELLHGLSREVLLSHGRSPQTVAAMLNSRLAGQVIYCDNWAHDYAWLAVLYDEADLRQSFRLQHVHSLLDDRRAGAWDAACAQARAGVAGQRHRASTDALVLQRALRLVQIGQQTGRPGAA
jgi:hypothetical protein